MRHLASKMNQDRVRKISFLIDKKEAKEKDEYRVEFLYDELDDLAGYIAHCANHEESKRKRDRWDRL
jgi:hypothetical protein